MNVLAPSATTRLAVERLCQSFGGKAVLDNVSFHVNASEVVCLLGHSGSGKTTLLRLAAGLDRPTAGQIWIDGTELVGPASFVPPEKRGIGVVFQDYALFPHLTVFENAVFGLRRGLTPQVAERVRKFLERVGLDSMAERYPHTLSAGEQQRAALVRALAPRPRVLLMDEPFSNLDGATRDSVRDMTMTLLREMGTTAIVVTHDPAEAMRIADRIVLMKAGRIVQIDTPRQVYNHPASLYAARYFSDVNEVAGICRNGRIKTALGEFPVPTATNDGAVVVCIRPHDLHIAESGIPAQVASAVFLGDYTVLTLSVDGFPMPLKARVRGTTVLATGQTTHLAYDLERIFVVPAEQHS